MLIIGEAAVIYVYFVFLGWGLARLMLPPVLSEYRTWFAPWIGLMMASVLLTWLSYLGIGVATAFYLVTIVGAFFAALSAFLRRPSMPASFRVAFAVAFLTTLLLALDPLLTLSSVPTTLSLGNNDPASYAAAADFLVDGSMLHPPPRDPQRPAMYNAAAVIGQRPGSFLLISLCDRLFQAPTYKVFSVLLAVLFAATPPLVAIFVITIGGGRLAALLALTMTVFNVNQFYDLYHGFAAQIFFQGCLIIGLVMIWQAEDDQEHWARHGLMLGLVFAAILGMFGEGVELLVIPYGLYAGSQLLFSKQPKWRVIRRYALAPAITIALNPFGLWSFLQVIRLWSAGYSAGWELPRWALPTDIVGLANAYNDRTSGLFAAVASIPVIYFAATGCRRWRNPRLALSLGSLVMALILYLWGVRHFSYGYHKLVTICSFLLISACAMGIARTVEEYVSGAVRPYISATALILTGTLCFLALNPLVAQMKTTRRVVLPDLAQLASIRSIAGARPIHILDNRAWNQMWAADFLDPVTIALDVHNYYGLPHVRYANELTLIARGHGFPSRVSPAVRMKVWWQNSSYVLIGPAD